MSKEFLSEPGPKSRAETVPAYRLRATQSVLAERERELLALKGPCSSMSCRLHYAHAGPCDIPATTHRPETTTGAREANLHG